MTPEEALRHAYGADLERLPSFMRGGFNLDALVSDHLAGKPNQSFHELRQMGHPSFPLPEDPEARNQVMLLQDQMQRGYQGMGWTPSQKQSLGREPGPYEMSPGRKLHDQWDARQHLYEATSPPEAAIPRKKKSAYQEWSEKWFGPPENWGGASTRDLGSKGAPGAVPGHNPRGEGAAINYGRQLGPDGKGRTHAYLDGTGPGTWFPGIPEGGFEEFFNPENFIGTFTTKMGPVIADAASQIGTSLLRDDMGDNAPIPHLASKVSQGVGDATVRSYGADWNRTSPQLAKDRGWRENDAMIDKNRTAYRNADGMTASDTTRSVLEPVLPESWKGQIPYIQPLINGTVSFANGMFDGSGALSATKVPSRIVAPLARAASRLPAPGVRQFAQSTADDIARHAASHPTFAQKFAYQAQDEAVDPGNIAGTIQQFFNRDDRDKGQFQADMKQQDQARKQGILQLESDQDQVVRPKPYGLHGFFHNLIH